MLVNPKLIEDKLCVLKNQPLAYIGRAANLLWIGFGPDVEVSDIKGKTRFVAQFALHVQCPWRILSPVGVFTGSGDFYQPATELSAAEYSTWEWDVMGNNLFDMKAEIFNTMIDENDGILMEEITADPFGGFQMRFDNHFQLDVFCHLSGQGELWRFFESGNDDPHFVVFE